MPIHINKINVKVFDFPIEFDITNDVTIIYGGNGTGKSKLLDSISETYKLYANHISPNYGERCEDITYSLYSYFDPTSLELSNRLSSRFEIYKELVEKYIKIKTIWNAENKNYEFQLRNGVIVQYLQLSTGEIHFLNILTNVLISSIENENVLLIDEPETSLSMCIQEKLFNILFQVNPNLQIIAVSNSPAIVGEHRDCLLDIATLFKLNE